MSYIIFSLRVTPQTKIFANFSQKSNFLGNYQSDRQTLKTNSPYFLTLFKVVDNHFFIRPTHCAQIEKNDPLKWPNDPFLRLGHPIAPKYFFMGLVNKNASKFSKVFPISSMFKLSGGLAIDRAFL